jgi:hypothetical protein
MRTDKYRFTKYFRKEQPDTELFDFKTDPYGTINISNQQKAMVKKLSPVLQMGNTGLYETNEVERQD